MRCESFILVFLKEFIEYNQVYFSLADGKLATRAPSSPKPFFPSNSSVSDFYRGDGASYAELYNQADLTILMFYSQWSLHSVEARKHFVRLARAFKDTDNVSMFS